MSGRLPLRFGHQQRYDLIATIATHINAQSYLEIGCAEDIVFSRILVPHKIGVDPSQGGTHRMGSDPFFVENTDTFDLIFIDGLHHWDQVLRDIDNSIRVLNPGGVIVMHDCLPVYQKEQEYGHNGDWLGSVWHAFFYQYDTRKYDMAVVSIDHGSDDDDDSVSLSIDEDGDDAVVTSSSKGPEE